MNLWESYVRHIYLLPDSSVREMANPKPDAPRRLPRRIWVVLVVVVIAIAAFSLGALLLSPQASPPSLPLALGTDLVLSQWAPGYYWAEEYFSWTAGGYLRGSWTATNETIVDVVPRLNCESCPNYRIYELTGTSGTFDYSYGSPNSNYPNMVIQFRSSGPDTVHITSPVEVIYPTIFPILAAGFQRSGIGPWNVTFTVGSPGAYLVGSFTAVNTTLWSYVDLPQEPINCGGWTADAPPAHYDGGFNYFFQPGVHAVGVMPCSTRAWSFTVVSTIGYFYP